MNWKNFILLKQLKNLKYIITLFWVKKQKYANILNNQ